MMDEKTIRRIQREGADALLDIGVSVPLKSFRLPFRRRPVQLRVTMKRPTLGGQIAFARAYLSLGTTLERMQGFTKEEEMRFLSEHGKALGRMVALALCRAWWKRKLLLGAVSWWVRNSMEHRYQVAAVRKFAQLMGTKAFLNIISSAERTNPMKPRLSQPKKGS